MYVRGVAGDCHSYRDRCILPESVRMFVEWVSEWAWNPQIGDWRAAGQTIDKLISTAAQNSFEPDHAVGIGLRGILLFCQGEVDAGVRQLHECMNVLSKRCPTPNESSACIFAPTDQ